MDPMGDFSFKSIRVNISQLPPPAGLMSSGFDSVMTLLETFFSAGWWEKICWKMLEVMSLKFEKIHWRYIFYVCANKHISACRSNTPHDDTHILELVVVKSSNIRARISVNSFWTLIFYITFHCLLNCTVWYHVAMYLFHMFSLTCWNTLK